MSPSSSNRRARPNHIDVVEAYEDVRGDLHVWADLGGHVIYLAIRRGAITNRKLDYGHAREVRSHGRPGQQTSVTVEDLVDDANGRALTNIFEEVLDRFDEHGEDWFNQNPPQRFSELRDDHEIRPLISRRSDLERRFRVAKRAPVALVHPHRRLITTHPDGRQTVVDRKGSHARVQ